MYAQLATMTADEIVDGIRMVVESRGGMTYQQANELLNLRRAGVDMPTYLVNMALELTGDREPVNRGRPHWVWP